MTHIVVEGAFDADLIHKLLVDCKGRFSIVVAHGKNAARPIARKILLQRREPTALIVDADTTEPQEVRQQVRELHDYFGAAADKVGLTVIAMVPEMEVIFFDRPTALANHAGRPLDPALVAAGRVAPKAVLDQVLRNSPDHDRTGFIGRLTGAELVDLASHPQVQELRRFVAGLPAARTAG